MSGEGLSGAAGFFLGKMAAENAQNNYNFVQRVRAKREQAANEETMQKLADTLEYACRCVKTLDAKIDEHKATIVQLRSDNAAYIGVNARLVEDYGRLEQQNALLREELANQERGRLSLLSRADMLERRSAAMNKRLSDYMEKELEWEAERNSRSSSHDGGAG